MRSIFLYYHPLLPSRRLFLTVPAPVSDIQLTENTTTLSVTWTAPCPPLANITSYKVEIFDLPRQDCQSPHNDLAAASFNSPQGRNYIQRSRTVSISESSGPTISNKGFNKRTRRWISNSDNIISRIEKDVPSSDCPPIQCKEFRSSDFCPVSGTDFCHTFSDLTPNQCYKVEVKIQSHLLLPDSYCAYSQQCFREKNSLFLLIFHEVVNKIKISSFHVILSDHFFLSCAGLQLQ